MTEEDESEGLTLTGSDCSTPEVVDSQGVPEGGVIAVRLVPPPCAASPTTEDSLPPPPSPTSSSPSASRRASRSIRRTSLFQNSKSVGGRGTDHLTGIAAALAQQPLFRGCNGLLLQYVSQAAFRKRIAPGEVLNLAHERPLLVVESGGIHVRVGNGPTVEHGPGTVLNAVGMLGLNAPHKVPEPESCYELLLECIASPPALLDARAPDSKLRFSKQHLSGDAFCFYTLCPLAAKDAALPQPLTGRLPLSIEGSPRHRGSESCARGGAQIAALTLELVKEAAYQASDSDEAMELQKAFEFFEENCRQLQSLWQSLTGPCGALFAGMPSEVLWAIAEVSDRVTANSGQRFLWEGESGAAGEDIYLIEDGFANVEKVTSVSKTESISRKVGCLGPGAVVGDVLLLGSRVPRAASVRAKNTIRAIRINSRGMLTLLQRFPGAILTMQHRMDMWTRFLRTRLPVSLEEGVKPVDTGREDALTSCNLFAGCSLAFLQEVNRAGSWCSFSCGQCLRLTDLDDDNYLDTGEFIGTLFVIVHGRCICHDTEGAEQRKPKEIVVGHCVEAREAARTEMRVLTAIALTLLIRRQDLHAALARHPEEREVFRRKTAIQEGYGVSRALAQVDVFKKCTQTFVKAIADSIDLKSYMPGQTLCIMGAKDGAQMFLLRSGCVVVERAGERLVLKRSGSTMGELMMLGVVGSRSATIRAMTFCFIMEVPRTAFVAAVDRFPDERLRFEQLAMQNMEMQIVWPFLKDVPSRMHLWLNMHASFRALPAGDRSLGVKPSVDSAMLLVSGKAVLVNSAGKELHFMNAGDSCNEHLLLGLPNVSGEYVLPKTPCELQLVSKEVWAALHDQFPGNKRANRERILRHLGERAETRCGVDPGGIDMLRRSGLFRALPDDVVALLRKCLEDLTFLPGSVIAEAGQEGDSLYLLLEGCIRRDPLPKGDLRGPRELHPGGIFGEAVLVGASDVYSHTFRAAGKGICIVQQLRRSALQSVVEDKDAEREILEAVAWAGDATKRRNGMGTCTLDSRLYHSKGFRASEEAFVKMVCKDAEDVFFAPSEVIIPRGEKCQLGVTPFFVMLAGQAMVEGELGVILGTIIEGEIFGEAGGMGLSPLRTATVRAGKAGITHCAKIHGCYIEEALKSSIVNLGGAEGSLGAIFAQRQLENLHTQKTRSKWLEDFVIPALRNSHLFVDWSPTNLEVMAAPLLEESYAPGETICVAGEAADSMLVILRGSVLLESSNGQRLGHLKEGASFGEVAALRLFGTRTATARAGPGSNCRVLVVPASTLWKAAAAPAASAELQHLEWVVSTRNKQVTRGLPLSALPISVWPDDIAARAVALQAEKIDLGPGEIWNMAPDDGPFGPYFSVLVRGRGNFEVTSPHGVAPRPVMQLMPGALIIEGLVAEFGGHVRATSACEAYRVRESDLMAAAKSMRSAQDWYYRFRLVEKKVRVDADYKLRNAVGCSSGLAPHPIDADIQSWKEQRRENLDRARQHRRLLHESHGRALLRRVTSDLTIGMSPRTALASTLPPPTAPQERSMSRTPSRGHVATRCPDEDLLAQTLPPPSELQAALGRLAPLERLRRSRVIGPGMLPLEGDLVHKAMRRSRSNMSLRLTPSR